MSARSFDRRLAGLLASASLLVALAPAAAQAAAATPASTTSDIADQIIVRHRASLTAGDRAQLRAAADVTLDRTLPLTGVEVVATDGFAGSRADALEALRSDPDVLWAEPNTVVRASTTDQYWGIQWGLHNTGSTGGTPGDDIDVLDAWNVTRGAGVTVGVVDTGVQSDHPDLAGQILAGTNYATDGHTTTADGNGHGTHVSGIIAAAENTIGVVGVAPAAQVQPYRALGDNGSGSTASVAAAFSAAANAGVRVVNASLGSTANSSTERQAISTHPNTLFVVAAGNDGVSNETTPEYPCAFNLDNVLCVGASDDDDKPATFSNYGSTSVDLFAPGDKIASTWMGSAYEYASGTSMATPMVSGVAALVAAKNPSFTALQIKAAILNSVDHPAALAGLSVTGGRLNAANAVGAGAGGQTATPTPTATATPTTTATATPTTTVAPTPTPTGSPTTTLPPLSQPTPTQAPTVAPTPTPTPSQAPVATPTPVAGVTPTTAPIASSPTPTPAVAASASAAATLPPSTIGIPDLPDVGADLEATGTTSSDAVRLSNARITKTKGRPRSLAFRLSGATTVKVTIQRRRADGTRTAGTKRSIKLQAGPQSLPLATTAAHGLGLRSGMWRVTLQPTGGTATTLWIKIG